MPAAARTAAIAMLVLLLGGCAALLGGAGDRFASRLGRAVLDSDDPATVRDGLPAYLLLIDGLLSEPAEDRRNVALLYAAAELNGAYAGNFAGDDRVRARRLADKAFGYARRGLCVEDPRACTGSIAATRSNSACTFGRSAIAPQSSPLACSAPAHAAPSAYMPSTRASGIAATAASKVGMSPPIAAHARASSTHSPRRA